MKRKKERAGTLEEYLRANRAASREIELEKNGGRWIAVDRPHKNKKKYDRKRDRRVDPDGPCLLYSRYLNNRQQT